MMTYVISAVFVLLTISILFGLYRLAMGPTVIDRIMAFDLITTSAVGVIVMLSIEWATAMYVELILIFSLLGFFGTVAFVFYLHRSYEVETHLPDGPAKKPSINPNDPS